MFSCERAQVVTDMFAGVEAEATEGWLWSVLHTHPVWDDGTVYGAGNLLARPHCQALSTPLSASQPPTSDERAPSPHRVQGHVAACPRHRGGERVLLLLRALRALRARMGAIFCPEMSFPVMSK